VQEGVWSVQGKPGSGRVAVPLRTDGSVLVNYRVPRKAQFGGLSQAFTGYSLSEIAQPCARPDTRFRDKIVIIGATFAGSNDFHYVPFLRGGKARSIPGMELHANMVRTLLNSRPIAEPMPPMLWLLALVPGLCGILAFGRLNWVHAALVALLIAAAWIAASLALFVLHDYALPVAVPLIGLALGAGGMGAYRAFGEERERQHVLGLWGRYQDPRQVEYLLQHPEARGGQGHEAPVTVLFADLKNFTKTVEHLPPGEALQVLNRYLALMTDVIRDEYGGFVDKYLGDGLMAQWGAPSPWEPVRAGEDHATTAVRACLELERRTRELTQSIAGSQDVTFGLRLTLHTGPVVVGWVGASRLEFTIIGDTVNVTSRLQETAKELDCEFLISETTYRSVEEWVRTGQQTEVMIRGRQKPLRVYEVLGEDSDASEERKL
jgi:adenylate cyclase